MVEGLEPVFCWCEKAYSVLPWCCHTGNIPWYIIHRDLLKLFSLSFRELKLTFIWNKCLCFFLGKLIFIILQLLNLPAQLISKIAGNVFLTVITLKWQIGNLQPGPVPLHHIVGVDSDLFLAYRLYYKKKGITIESI